MKKKYYIIALCICIIAIFICSKQFYIGNNEQNKASTNHKDSVEKPPKANLDTAYYLNEKDITRCKTDSLFVDVDKFLKTKSTYDDLVSLIDAMANETPSSPVYGEKIFYVSKTAIYYWEINDKNINTSLIDLFVFSQDKQHILQYTMLYRDGKFIDGGINDLDDFSQNVLIKHKSKRYVFLHEVDKNCDSSAPILLDEDNQLYQTATSGDYVVNGDYFKKLSTISVSYNDLINKGNLKKIVLK